MTTMPYKRLYARYRAALERIELGEPEPQKIAHYALHAPTNRKLESLLGRKFNRLLVIFYAGTHVMLGDGNRRRYWLCMCDCGNLTSASTTSLKRNNKQSCGCLAVEERRQTMLDWNDRRRKSKEERLARRREFYRLHGNGSKPIQREAAE